MPLAWRTEHRRENGRGARAYPPGELETRPIFRRGEGRTPALPEAAGGRHGDAGSTSGGVLMAVNLHLPEVRKTAVQPAPNDTPGTCKRQGCGRPFTGP